MPFRNALRTPLTRRVAFMGTCFLTGCGSGGFLSRNDGQRSTLSLSTIDLTGLDTQVESGLNNQFEQAERVNVSADPVVVQGSIESSGDVDVFDLGPVVPGDQIFVEMTTSETLDGVIALFDDTGSAILVNDHRNVYLGVREPFIQVTIQHASDNCYVAVSATPTYNDSGTYTLLATKESVTLTAPNPNTVLLVFDGAQSVRIGSRPSIDVPPLDTGDISSAFDGMTGRIVADVVVQVRADFAPFDVRILSTSEGATFEPGMSRLFFGTYDAALLGVAEGVDEFNSDPQQEAIVFTDTFRAFVNINPTPDELAQAMANVASHEIGHLLGLVHTEDPGGIMDVTASLRELLQDQSFSQSPLYELVFPLGFQDAVVYLLEAVGGDEALAFQKERQFLQMRARLPVVPAGEAARETHHFSLCGLAHRPVEPCPTGGCATVVPSVR